MGKKLLIAIALVGAFLHWSNRQPTSVAVAAPPPEARVITSSERDTPKQRDVSTRTAFEVNGYSVRALAEYSVTARVLSVEHYRTGREADLSPVDFALGWGRMSDPAVTRRISISQSGRWYFWRYEGEPPLPHREIETSSANVHLIPASAEVSRALSKVRSGQVVTLRGYLVEASAKDGWRWKSSLSRDDTGNGSCEVMFVQVAEAR